METGLAVRAAVFLPVSRGAAAGSQLATGSLWVALPAYSSPSWPVMRVRLLREYN